MLVVDGVRRVSLLDKHIHISSYLSRTNYCIDACRV